MTVKQRATRAAKEFRGGRGLAWAWIADRDMIVDAECMDQVRYATLYSDGGALNAGELMEFRAAFVEAIAKLGFVL